MAVLYVEDDALTREAIAGRLRRRGYLVVEATSGEEALNLASSPPAPCVALLDIDLPGIDGVETYRRLLKLFPQLPAVVCSAKLAPGRHSVFEALGVPVTALLAKPCAFPQLLTAIEHAVQFGSA